MNRDEERTIASNVGSRTPHRVESCGYEPKRPSARIHSRRRPIATPSKGIPSNETPEGETLKGTSHDPPSVRWGALTHKWPWSAFNAPAGVPLPANAQNPCTSLLGALASIPQLVTLITLI